MCWKRKSNGNGGSPALQACATAAGAAGLLRNLRVVIWFGTVGMAVVAARLAREGFLGALVFSGAIERRH